MFKINIKSFISIITSKAIIKLSKFLFKGGSNFPGRVALKIDKNILSTVSKGYEVILITGTNGKTTTTSMIYNMVKEASKNSITNSTGANMLPGITACFVENYKFKSSKDKIYAVIEVDEANLPLVTEYIKPKVITVTNLFRDQLDRYGEVYTTLNKILDGIKKSSDSALILNGDESLLGDLDLENKILYYGFDYEISSNKQIDINADAKFCKRCKSPYNYNYITYNHLGSFYCSECGYKRPELDYSVDNIIEQTASGSLVYFNGNEYYINQPGTYNIYNALCAYSVAKFLGLENSIIFNALKSTSSSFGRQETLNIESKQVKIILVKNPAGFDEAINTLTFDTKAISAAFILNDNYADGRDVSWIWDVNFEKLSSIDINKVMVSGIRLYDMAVRLKVAGLNQQKFILCDNYEILLNQIKDCETEYIYVLATYTAMINYRKFLHSKGYIKKLW
ncbi:Mur ligase middle domain protein [Clostridiales bacterium oral taxon 876 str. F0540]|nr:Mur ligase middle domain protein [Clostridiales bacterium oral taxon 876 str. F0540]